MSDLNKQKKQLNNYALFSGIAIQMFVIIGIGTYIGVKLDEHFTNKYNLFTIILSLLAVILAIIYVIKRVISLSKDS